MDGLNQELRAAVIKGDFERVKELQGADPSVTYVEDAGLSCFHYAAQYNGVVILDHLLTLACKTPLEEVVNKRGNTALHHASLSGSLECVKLLVERFGNKSDFIDRRNTWGETALHLAAQSLNVEAYEVLKKVSNTSLLDKWERSAEQVAKESFLGRQELIRHVDADKVVQNGRPKRSLSKLIEAPLDEGRFQQWLQDDSIDVCGRDMFGLTALHKVAAFNKDGCVILLLRIAPHLLNATDAEGMTPLHHAANMEADRAVKVLLSRPNVDVDARNKAGMTAQQLAPHLFVGH